MLNASKAPPVQSVLIVEDDEDIRDAIREALEIEGYAVEVVTDGKEAIDRLTNQKPLPALILLDLMLPYVTGWEVLEVMRKDDTHPMSAIPIVITSAAGDSALTVVHQVEGHLKKPIDLEHLLEMVARYCQASSPDKN